MLNHLKVEMLRSVFKLLKKPHLTYVFVIIETCCLEKEARPVEIINEVILIFCRVNNLYFRNPLIVPMNAAVKAIWLLKTGTLTWLLNFIMPLLNTILLSTKIWHLLIQIVPRVI